MQIKKITHMYLIIYNYMTYIYIYQFLYKDIILILIDD